jgi:CDP-glucose 4,6-dehydratase
VLVTGLTGFKGSWLALWLAELGADVVGFSRGVPTQRALFEDARVGEVVQTVDGDIRDAEAVARAVAEHRPEVVIHMAAQPLVRRSFREPVLTYEVNVMGTVNVLEAVRRAGGVRTVLNVTTDKCYENREWVWGYREHEPKGGHDPYSNSKACSELVTSAYRDSFFAPGGETRVASARAGNVIGGGDWAEDRLIPDLMRAALAGETAPIRSPQAIRPWQHVLNPLSGYLLLLERLWEDETLADGWNFGPADLEARPVGWIVERVAEAWGEGFRYEVDPGPHPHEAHYLKLDSSKARMRLGWMPTWDLDEGLERVVEWYRGAQPGADARELTLSQIRAFEGNFEPILASG